MKSTYFKSLLLVALPMTLLSLASCKMGPVEEPYPDLPEKVKAKLINKDFATEMSSGFVDHIQKLQDLSSKYRELQEINSKELSVASRESGVLKEFMNQKVKPNFNLSSSSYYTLEELESYIAYAKREAAKQQINLEGFRIYFGLFPESKEKYGKKSGNLTVFISPTGRPNEQKGAFFMTGMILDDSEISPDITSIGPLEYGGNGNPPAAAYPN
ncbi:hypothetical protein [Ascidiimonas aurantiaca]|uniref:hypothetical protein n=1 Tax=Ascidiimonas aurantiaca TaxID=1685432 RepID=UPI0030EF78CE